MARKKKDKVEEKQNLDELEEGEYRLETWWEVLVRNYKEVPGIRAVVKLVLYFIFFIVVIILMNVTLRGDKANKKTNTTTTTDAVIKYNDILNELLNNKSFKCEIKIYINEYQLNGVYGNSILTGSLFTSDGTYSYKIKNNKVYEVKLKTEEENNQLLRDIDLNIIDNKSLVDIIKHSSGIKVENGYKYSKVPINNIDYAIEIGIDNNHIKTIILISDDISYKFTYDEIFVID